MRVWILSAFSLLLVSAAPKGNGAEDKIVAPAVSLSKSEILLACTSGLPFGETLETAFAYCDKTVGEDRLASLRLGQGTGETGNGISGKGTGKGGKGKGKGGKGKGGKAKGGKGKGKAGKGKGGKKCAPVTDVLENLKSKAKKDRCVFRSIGWVDNDGDIIENAMKIVVTSLPAEVALEMSVNNIKICALNKAKEWAQTPKRQRCDATYNTNERERLQNYEAKVAGMKCIKTVMSTSCRAFLDTAQSTGVVAPVILPQPILESSSSEQETSEERSSEEGGSSHSGETPIQIPSSHEGVFLHSGEDSSEEGSSYEGGYSHSDGYSSEEASHEGGAGYGGHGGYDSPIGHDNHGGSSGYIGHGPPNTGLVQPYLPPPIAPFPLPPHPGQPIPFPIFQGGGAGTLPGGGNFQQVIVEQPHHPQPIYHPPLPPQGRWPSNLVAALLPADWVAQNLEQADNDDDYQYGYDYEEYGYGDYYGEDEYYDYVEYNEGYVDYEDDANQDKDDPNQGEAPVGAVTVPLLLSREEGEI